jgi:hypothetical protein
MSATFKIYVNENNNETPIFFKDYIFNLNIKIIDTKTEILNELNNHKESKYNYLNLDNITFRVYKDYGKQFFDLGLLPNTIDNYKLEQFTDSGRTFSFIAIPANIEIKQFQKKNDSNNSFLKNMIKESREKEKINNNNEFTFYEDEFPPLNKGT